MPDLMQKLLLILVSDPEESLRGSESVDPFGVIRAKTMFFDGRRRRQCKDICFKKLDDPHSQTQRDG